MTFLVTTATFLVRWPTSARLVVRYLMYFVVFMVRSVLIHFSVNKNACHGPLILAISVRSLVCNIVADAFPFASSGRLAEAFHSRTKMTCIIMANKITDNLTPFFFGSGWVTVMKVSCIGRVDVIKPGLRRDLIVTAEEIVQWVMIIFSLLHAILSQGQHHTFRTTSRQVMKQHPHNFGQRA
jgi:hypothetical protein